MLDLETGRDVGKRSRVLDKLFAAETAIGHARFKLSRIEYEDLDPELDEIKDTLHDAEQRLADMEQELFWANRVARGKEKS